jgi:lysozyme
VKVKLTQGEYDALVSFVFNVGAGALASSKLLRELNAHHRTKAADQLLRWTKAGGRDLPGLVRRRRAERGRFLS